MPSGGDQILRGASDVAPEQHRRAGMITAALSC